MPQEVGENQRYSRIFYMAPNLIRGGCLLVNYRWSIFHFGNPTYSGIVNQHSLRIHDEWLVIISILQLTTSTRALVLTHQRGSSVHL